MDKSIITDIVAGGWMLLFTTADVGIEGTIFEIISKFGVVAVLWFWLRSMKEQMKEQLETFGNETKMLRTDHKESLKEFRDIHSEHRVLLEEQLKAKDEIIKELTKE